MGLMETSPSVSKGTEGPYKGWLLSVDSEKGSVVDFLDEETSYVMEDIGHWLVTFLCF